jgi:hypothetical protein
MLYITILKVKPFINHLLIPVDILISLPLKLGIYFYVIALSIVFDPSARLHIIVYLTDLKALQPHNFFNPFHY